MLLNDIAMNSSLPSLPPHPSIDRTAVVAELAQAFDRYEDALVNNRVDVLDELFWNDERTLRFGARENLFGYTEIAAFRAGRPAAGLMREILTRHLVTFGDDTGVANITFRRIGQSRMGRQSQTWVRFAEGWRVVAAHVSWMDE